MGRKICFIRPDKNDYESLIYVFIEKNKNNKNKIVYIDYSISNIQKCQAVLKINLLVK